MKTTAAMICTVFAVMGATFASRAFNLDRDLLIQYGTLYLLIRVLIEIEEKK